MKVSILLLFRVTILKKTCKQTLDLNNKFNLIFEHKLLSAKEIRDLKEHLSSLEEDLLTFDEDDDDMTEFAEQIREEILDIKKNSNLIKIFQFLILMFLVILIILPKKKH